MILPFYVFCLLGECVISSVLSCRSKDLKWWTSVTAWLQLSFIWQAKDNTPSRCEGGPTPKERPSSFGFLLASSFYPFVSSPLSLPYANWASQEGGVFVSPDVLIPVCRFSFCELFLSLSFSRCYFGLLFPIPAA